MRNTGDETMTARRASATAVSTTGRRRRRYQSLLALLATLSLFASATVFFPSIADAHNTAPTGADGTYGGGWPPNTNTGWQVPSNNPPIDDTCGIDIGLLIDRSGSIADANAETEMRAGAVAFVDSLAGTPSRIGFWSFGNNSSSDTTNTTYPNEGLTPLDPAGVTSLTAEINTIPIVSGVATNTERGFEASASALAGDAPDFFVVLTDGNPTFHAGDENSGGTTNNDDVDGAIRGANLIKAQGARVFGVGIGNNISTDVLGLMANPEAFDGTNITTAGYATTSFDELQTAIFDLVTALCGGSVTVEKNVDGTLTNDWNFNIDGPGGPYNGTTGDDGLGRVLFDVAPLSAAGSEITLTEALVPGHDLQNVSCTNSNGDDPVLSPAGDRAHPGVAFNLNKFDVVNCVFDNITQNPAIDITKTANPAGPVNAGDLIGFDVKVDSTGDSPATGVQVTDNLPAGVSWAENPDHPDCAIAAGTLSCDFGSIDDGDSETVHVEGRTDAQDCGQIDNSASVSTTNDGSDSDSASVTVRCANVQIEKTADEASVSAGDDIGFTITATNNGTGSATGVKISDTLPTGSGISWSEDPDKAECSIAGGDELTCDVGTLAPSASFTVHVESPTTAASCGAYDNTASVTTTNDGSGEASARTEVECPSVDLDKRADASSVSAGDDIGFTITAKNNGAGTASGAVISDTLPTGAGISWSEDPDKAECSIAGGDELTCNVGTLASGATFSVHVSSPTTLESCGDYDNLAELRLTNGTGDEGESSTSVKCADIEITKTAIEAGETCPGIDGVTLEVDEGTDVEYCYVVHNGGNDTAVDVKVVDDNGTGNPGDDFVVNLSGLTAGDLPAGGTATGDAGPFGFDVGTRTNIAEVTATTEGGLPLSDDDDAVVKTNDIAPTIDVTKKATPDTVLEPGAEVDFDVEIENTSAESVTIVSITDSVDGGAAFDVTTPATAPVLSTDCADGVEISAGGTYNCTFSLLVEGNAGDVVDDTVTAVVVDDDKTETDDSDDETVDITDVPPTIDVTKTADPQSVAEPGAEVDFDVEIENLANESVWIVSITDSVDGGAAFDVTTPATAPVLSTDCADGVEISAGGTYNCTFSLLVEGNAGDVVDDTVTAVVVDDDKTETDDSDDEDVEITDVEPTVEVIKDADPTQLDEPGGMVTYTVYVTNTSFEDVWLRDLVDSVDGGPEVDVFGIAGTTCVDNTLVGAGLTYDCEFEMSITGNAGDVVNDIVTATVEDDDKSTASDKDDADVEILDVLPTVHVLKDADPTEVDEPGGSVAYTVAVTNTSFEDVTITSLVDSVDGGPDVDITSIPGTTCVLGEVLSPAETYMCEFSLTVTGDAGDVIEDTVTAIVEDDDKSTAEDDDDADVEILDVLPTIEVDKTDDGAVVTAPGGPVDYAVSVTNTSVEDVAIVSITDSVDGGAPFEVTAPATPPVLATDCETGVVITPGDTYQCTFTVDVLGLGGSVTDTVLATVVDNEENPADDDDDEVTPIDPVADLAIDKVVINAESFTVGSTGTYGLIVSNLGPSPATNVVVNDTLPAGLSIVSIDAPGWTCDTEGQSVVCDRPGLDVLEQSVIEITVDVTASVTGTEVTNVATVTADEFDPDLSNNEDAVITPLVSVLPVVIAQPLPATGSDDTLRLVGWGLMALSLGAALALVSWRRPFLVTREN